MADNVAVTPGSGATVATDERTIGGSAVHVQRVAPHGVPAITVGQVDVGDTSTSIVAADSTRQSITLVNRGAVSVFIDDGTATTSGFELEPDDALTLSTGAVINGITASAYTASGDAKVHYVATHD